MSKIVDNVWGAVDYNTYIRLKREILAGQFAIGVSSIFAHSSFASLMNVLFTTLLIYINAQDGSKTKDVKEVRELYDAFITNCGDLNKTFELDNPLEIYELFNMMLYSGLLSKDLNFDSGEKIVRDIETISGANICLGTGVCRHVSVILSDVLNKSGIESDTLIGKFDSIPIELSTKLMVQDFASSLMIDSGLDINIPVPRGHANHMITAAKKDDYAYYLDSMHRRIYHIPDKSSNLLVSDLGIMKIKDKKYKLEKYTGLNITKREEEIFAGENIKKLFDDNMDILAKFYIDNKEIYEEISNKMLKMSRLH